MAVPQAEKLIHRAKLGERLNPAHRRICLAFLMHTQAAMNNEEQAELFQVSSRQIRKDRKGIREERAKFIREDDVGLVVSDIVMVFEKQISDIEHSKMKCKMGTGTYLDHCKAISDLQLKTVKALQDLGYYPKNLGNMTIDKYEFKSTVVMDTRVQGRPVNMTFEAVDADFVDVPPPVKLLEAVVVPTPIKP